MNDDESNIISMNRVRNEKHIEGMKDRLASEIKQMDSRRLEVDQKKLRQALENLLKHARADHGGGRRCAMFLLSLWNGGNFKADLQDLLYVDPIIHDSMVYVLDGLYYKGSQLDNYLTEDEIKPVYDLWGEVFRSK